MSNGPFILGTLEDGTSVVIVKKDNFFLAENRRGKKKEMNRFTLETKDGREIRQAAYGGYEIVQPDGSRIKVKINAWELE